MKIADLYIRVSTDEQADKGYSQRGQEELLRKYCDLNKISVRKVIYEDHSAKTFNRPEWKAYLLDLKRHKGKSDFVLFLKWDRFSRNAGDAYQMINTLRKLGVEPQAIEQPLDLSIPENKMMLAFYLAAPEVENDRRALNVIVGMRRARKEGRYMGLAPVGYVNKTDESGRKYITPDGRNSVILVWAFEEIAKGVYNTEQIFKMAKQRGFTGTKSLFWFAIRNPIYCGKIFINKYKDEESRFVKGLHEPIITEELYYEVQDVLDGRKRGTYRLKVVSAASLPLRGFLTCPSCGKLLTGSASKGNTKYYAYYHCYGGCKFRFRADEANSQFERILKQYTPKPEMLEIYKAVLLEEWQEQTGAIKDDHKQVASKIKETEGKLAYLRELLVSKQIEPEDYREMKADYTEQLQRLRVKEDANSSNTVDLKTLPDEGLANLLKVGSVYETAAVEQKREIISSMFPEKLHFENSAVRTGRVNEAARLIYLLDSQLSPNKKGQNSNKSVLSSQVGMTGFEPAASSSRTKRATGLRYIPIGNC